MTRPDVSVVIVSWNTRALTLACLASLPAAARAHTVEVWVVDNASTDGSVDAIRHTCPDVQVLANAGNLGFAAANNQGLARTSGRYVLLLNSDTVAPPGAIDTLVRFADAHPRAGVVGPRLVNPDGSYQSGPTPFPSFWTETLAVTGIGRRLISAAYPSVSSARALAAQQADFVGGACMLARREAVDAVGGLDDGYFMYSEEPDWCWRMRRAGWEVWYTPDAEIIHVGGQSTAQRRHSMTVALYRSKIRFLRRYRGHATARAAMAVFVVVSQVRTTARCLLGLEPRGVPLRWSDFAARERASP